MDALLTDAASRNLKIEGMIVTSLESDHEPVHLLCKSYSVEKLDASNLNVLSQVENSINQRHKLEDITPPLKSFFFFHGKKTTVEAGIDAWITLVSYNKPEKPCSQTDLFDFICELEGVRKYIFLYQQCRFAKLGKAAASVAQAYPMLKMLLDETTSTNQLVKAWKIYQSVELFFTELPASALPTSDITTLNIEDLQLLTPNIT